MEVPKHNGYLDKRTNKVYTSIRIFTYSLPCSNYYHELFYVNGVKKVPLNIGELTTPFGLAYWTMDEGARHGPGFILCTHSYTLEEVQLLIKVLKGNLDLNCTYHKGSSSDQYRIYINSDSMNKFRSLVTPHFYSLVTPHFHSSVMYKFAD